MKKLITWTSLILAVSLFAEPGDNKGQLKRSMKVVPLSSIYLSTENGGTSHASVVLADGVGIYTTAALLGPNSSGTEIGGDCNDGNPNTEKDMYTDTNGTCIGTPIVVRNSIKCKGDPIGSEITVDGISYLVVDNDTIKENLNRAETLCTSNVTNMMYMFLDAKSFNQPIGNWDTSNVTNMSGIFYRATSFNQPIGDWDTSNVTDMSGMFYGAISFNQPLNWDTSNVIEMSSMFYSATSFNQTLNWNTSNVIEMSSMFYSATSFNQTLNWNTSNVTSMGVMFRDATSFNQAIGDWSTSNVTNMFRMFNGATSFNQNIGNWDTGRISNYLEFAIGSALTSANAPAKNGTKFLTTLP